ncbi:MAG: diacylglycerol kinase family protein [Myxococcales bacterium]|nr:diacylglycerol kinase family protein [Myxococcales bacterium]
MMGLIVNPHARRGRDPELADRLWQVIRRAGAQGRTHLVVTPDLAALREAVASFAAKGVPLVATCGGDGTTMATVTELVRAYGPRHLPSLMLLRGGSVNTIARNLHIRGRPEQLLARALERLRVPEDLALWPGWPQGLLRVRDRLQGRDGPERFGCLFAAAMGARFLELHLASPRQSLGQAVALMLRTVASTLVPGGGPLARRLFAQTEVRLWVDGEQVPQGHVRLVLAATVPDVGLGMRVAWQAGRVPGRLHVVASGLAIGTMARQLGRVRRGEPLGGGPHLDRLATSLRVQFVQPQPYTLDGDLFRAEELEVEAGPQLWVLGPLP